VSTQENLTNRAQWTPSLALLALLSLIFLNLSSWWLWSSLYFQRQTLSNISLILGLITILIITFNALIQITFGHTKSRKLTNVCIALLLTYFGFKYLKQLELISEISTPLQNTLALATAIFSGLLTFKISLDSWKRLHMAIIVGGLIFILFPFILANAYAPTIYWPSPSHQAPMLNAPKLPTQNTIILLLDELSVNAAGPVVDQLKNSGLNVELSSMDAAGKNTINVIPAIWTRGNFDQSAPCGPTQLCSSSNMLDFARVRASSENIDIVGFYHRYCSIQGLRFCSFTPLPPMSVDKSLLCRLPAIDRFNFLNCHANTTLRESWISLRDKMQKTLFEAPFWQKGGVLYAHLLVPHPLMGIPLKSLEEEYTDNISNGATLVNLVAKKAKLVFGHDFRIIIFSDHPLRSDLWCADKNYISLGCTPTPAQTPAQVPLIIATPSDDRKPILRIHKSQNIFDLLY
jgi:hypothetical protein